MIYIIGVAITFFLSFILMTKKGKSSSDKVLFGWLCVILVQLVLFSLISSGEYVWFPYLLGLEIPLPLLHGPFLFLYTKTLIDGNTSFRKIPFHFIPFLMAFLSTIPFLLLEENEKIYVYQNEGEGYRLLSSVILFGIILSGITYTVLSLYTLRRHRRQIKDNFSYTEKINLEWLYRLILGLSCIWIIVFFADDEVIFTFVVLFVVFIGYYGIKQVGIFTNTPHLALTSPVSETIEKSEFFLSPVENAKYENSSLSDNQAEDIHRRLALLMQEKKLYQIQELTLAMVSEELDLHPNTLSQVINSVEKKNFFDYINSLRIEEFKERIAIPDNQKYTLLSIAYECGFNSKTSFNRNFKNLTGQSPSEYLKERKSKSD
jgi:AraC-like DNA-binding protein